MKKIFVLAMLAFSLLACEEEETTLEVKTLGFDQIPIENVEVLVSAGIEDTGQLAFEERSRLTNGEGKVTFNFSDEIFPGQSGFVALELSAIYLDDTTTTTYDIESRKKNEATILLPS